MNPGPTMLDRFEVAGIPVVAGFEGVSWLILDLKASLDGDLRALAFSAGGGRFVEAAVLGAGSLDENLGMPVPAALVGLMGILESCMLVVR